jgi:branched-chain amino acid transport system ATP-binding protein
MSVDAGLLNIRGLKKQFGMLVAVDDVSTSFYEDELCAIIGPNGAGKTTVFNLLTGELEPTAGEISFDGVDITEYSPHEIARTGLIRSFQITNVFEDMTVYDNDQTAVLSNRFHYDFWRQRDGMDEVEERCYDLLSRMDLDEEREKTAGNLSHGDQRMLEITLALAKDPDLLLLDEPTSGMSSAETSDMIDVINDLAEDIPIVLIEHKMSFVRNVADRLLVLHNGQVLADGDPDTVRENKQVQDVYLKSYDK